MKEQFRRRALGSAAILFLALATPAAAQDTTPPDSMPQKCCASLAEVRQNIDRVDAAIIALMAERGAYVAEAGKFKPDAASVHDGARVERIIARVRELAAAQHLPPDVAEATYRAMIASFTDYEKKLVELRAGKPAGTP